MDFEETLKKIETALAEVDSHYLSVKTPSGRTVVGEIIEPILKQLLQEERTKPIEQIISVIPEIDIPDEKFKNADIIPSVAYELGRKDERLHCRSEILSDIRKIK